MGEMRSVYKVLVRKPEGKGPFGRPRHIQEDKIRIGLNEIGWECVNWIYLAQD
jgi:hypothetical protein